MNEVDYDTQFSPSGFITPPLSPTKSTSTDGWPSPRTPGSPCKTKSCLFFQDVGTEDGTLTPPTSPTKPTFTSRLSGLQLTDAHTLSREYRSSTFDKVSPYNIQAEGIDTSQFRHSESITHSNHRSVPATSVPVNDGFPTSLDGRPPCKIVRPVCQSPTDRSKDSSSSKRTNTESSFESILARVGPTTGDPSTEGSEPSLHSNACENGAEPQRLGRLSLRVSSSPLRPSQWVTRGGLLSSPRGPNRTPDRFISFRRPPNTTRESFELNKPTDRLIAEKGSSRGSVPGADPFSRRLHRSGRMNDELRSLREAHSVMTGRATYDRRGANLIPQRRSSTLGVRQVSAGAVWNVGGNLAVSDTVVGIPNGRGGMLGSGTNAPLYTSMFLSRSDPEAELETYERRLALAFDVGQADRVLEHTSFYSSNPSPTPSSNTALTIGSPLKHVWRDNAWTRDVAITILDAPQLRDDYYCSLLAYSHTVKCLAVGLGNFVHLWSEREGVDTPESLNSLSTNVSDVQHVSSLAFSSAQGAQAILAVGRADGRLTLWSPFDAEPRFNAEQPKPISCVSFRPTVVRRPSLRDKAMMVSTEELLAGDEAGHVYFYSVEWPNETDSALFGWHGALTLLIRMTMHTQQICGLSWAFNGEFFASGGNDNACFLFETKKILQSQSGAIQSSTSLDVRRSSNGESTWTISPGRNNILAVDAGREKHKWELNAAVKAIAFCPWQRGLLAIGGGSNDRCIHFYHTISGACLATIDCAAQVTSLIWSTTRKEIAATFGFAQPEHPFRVAVFAWPSCEQIVAIPWFDENRALFAIAYPGGPNMGRGRGEDGVWSSRGAEEGCIVVAASDAAIRFHEIWTDDRRSIAARSGLLGGSDILESLHGIERDSEQIIR